MLSINGIINGRDRFLQVYGLNDRSTATAQTDVVFVPYMGYAHIYANPEDMVRTLTFKDRSQLRLLGLRLALVKSQLKPMLLFLF